MANRGKRISELTALTSASLDTTIVGIDNGTTYKIELDILADAVTSRVNILDRDRLASLESVTSSFETKGRNVVSGSSQLTSSFDGRYVISGSITQTTWDNIASKPADIISSSTQISDLGFISSSHTDITSLNSFTSSQDILNTAFTNGINARLQTSSFNDFSESINGRVASLESWSSSLTDTFATDLEVSIVSSSVAATIGIISQNTGLVSTSSFNSFTQSIDDRVDSLENVTSSYLTSLEGAISSSSQLTGSFDTRYTLSGSVIQTTWDNISGKPNGIVSQSTDLTQLNQFTQSIDGRVDSLENATGSYITSLNGTISGSSQLTSSYDTRYILSGSVQPLPNGVISGSSQLTSSYDSRYSLSGSVLTSFSSSVDNRLDTLESSIITGSVNYTQVKGPIKSGVTTTGIVIISGSITTTGNPVQIMVTGDANPIGGTAWTRLQIYRDGNGIGNIIQVENSSNLNVPYCVNVIDTPSAGTYTYSMRTVSGFAGTFDFGEYDGPLLTAVELKSQTSFQGITLISGSSQLTSSYDERYVLSGSITQTTWDNIVSKPSGIISGSSQLTTFETKGSGIYSSSAQLPSGIISGSSQLTASYDTRYTLSGSVVSGTTPAGTISGSSQLTSSFDGRYTQTGSFNTLTASFNSFTTSAQSVTTGSNSFNGTQTITGSLIITTGSFVASQILANTASLYLTSGSNLYVQNNGVVEITGSLIVSGSTRFATAGGDEGGEIEFGIPQTNTTLSTRVVTDIWRDRLRIFDGNTKGVYIDLSKAPTGVGGELMHKTSGFVNTDVDVSLGNLKARIPASGNKSLQLSTISGTYSVYGSDVYSLNGIGGGTLSSPITVTTTPTYLNAGHSFTVAGSTDTWVIMDTSAGISWRITMIIGPSYLNNFISIERLH